MKKLIQKKKWILMTWILLVIIVIMIFWRKKKKLLPKNDDVWVKTKKEILRGILLLIPYIKKEDSEHLKIKWTDSRKEYRILIKNVLLKYSKKEFRCLLNSTLMVHTRRKLSMISPLKSDKEKKQ